MVFGMIRMWGRPSSAFDSIHSKRKKRNTVSVVVLTLVVCNVFLFFLSLYFLVFGVYVSAFYLFRMYLKHRNLCYTHKNLVHAYRMNVRRSIQVLCTQNFVRIPIQATFLTSETFNLQFESLAFHSITQNRCVCVCALFFVAVVTQQARTHCICTHRFRGQSNDL